MRSLLLLAAAAHAFVPPPHRGLSAPSLRAPQPLREPLPRKPSGVARGVAAGPRPDPRFDPFVKLILCVAIDLVGASTYAIPAIGEGFDVGGLGAVFALMNFYIIQQTKINPGAGFVNPNSPLNAVTAELKKVEDIHATIELGAKAFLRAEYTICVQFLLAFSVVLLILTGLCGMMVAVNANARTTVAAASEPPSKLTAAFNVAFRAGAVMGYALCAMGLATLLLLLLCYKTHFATVDTWNVMMDCAAGFGLGGSSVAMFIATHLKPVVKATDVEAALKLQLISTTFLIVPFVVYLAKALLPESFEMDSVVSGTMTCSATGAAICVSVGALGGLLIGLVTEYYTSHSYQPVRECAYVCKQGAAVNMIYGLALGYKSAIIPVYTLAAIIYFAFSLADLYGVALAALGMLSTLATGLTIDGYGPVTDNAGGIAEMSLLPESVREKTDCLDAAGNTTAAIGKGFAIGSAALVSLALYGAFVVRLGITGGVNVLQPLTFAALLVGANLPYWFSAMTMKSVGLAAAEMVQEVERQFKADPSLLDRTRRASRTTACVEISTKASLREMIAPAALVMLTPLVAGTFFGVQAVFGILTGGLVSGVQLAISMSNSAWAWKKYISGGFDPDPALRKKDANGNSTPVHDAAVTGDTVGDPFKDTSGPALNILMKLMAILSLVFAQYFQSINNGKGLFNV
ncbi:hydrogen-translocating pyrophosphatase [Aureococcus anophagefferens]|nr:hydrogen-translocating pyrophosphatase [Aureococcus anophagefferens]